MGHLSLQTASQISSKWVPPVSWDQQRCRRRPSAVKALPSWSRHGTQENVSCQKKDQTLCTLDDNKLKKDQPHCAWDGNKVKKCGTTLGIGITSGFVVQLLGPPWGGSGSGSGWFGGGGGGGGDGGNFWSRICLALAANKEDEAQAFDPHGLPVGIEVPVEKLSSMKRYKVVDVEPFDLKPRRRIKEDDPLFEFFSLRPGEIYRKEQLQAELEHVQSCGMFEKVDLDCVTQPDGTIKAKFSFNETQWLPANKLSCINVGNLAPDTTQSMNLDMSQTDLEDAAQKQNLNYQKRVRGSRSCLLPWSEQSNIEGSLISRRRLTARLLQQVRDAIQKWYHDKGYVCAQVVNFGNLNTKHVYCEVVEGDITDVVVQFQDKMGYPMEGTTNEALIRREIPRELAPGRVFNIEAGKQALRNLNALGLFSNIEINPRSDEINEGGIVVEVKLKELEPKTTELNTEWSIVPGRGGRPTLASMQPGGSITFEHRNLKGLNRSLLGTVTSNNLFNPQDDLGFKMEYVHPYLDGLDDPRNRVFRASCFNSRKMSPVFTGGPGLEEVPAIWVDRTGLKATITNNLTRQSKLSYGLVLEQITTRDETYTVCTNGARALPSGALSMDGPPTTLSGTGVDQMGFFQANITRDNTKFVNGTPVGARDVFQFDQGLGVGSKSPMFNRHQLALTRFIQLKEVYEGAGYASPPVLVLHGRYGGCIGDLPSYDAFTLGGPYSVRGYNMGELGACRNILEVATEVRVPIRRAQGYVFAEYGTDLGTSKYVKGNPTEFFRRAGQGYSYGVGMKFGLMRAEYAIDGNIGTGAMIVRFGERF